MEFIKRLIIIQHKSLIYTIILRSFVYVITFNQHFDPMLTHDPTTDTIQTQHLNPVKKSSQSNKSSMSIQSEACGMRNMDGIRMIWIKMPRSTPASHSPQPEIARHDSCSTWIEQRATSGWSIQKKPLWTNLNKYMNFWNKNIAKQNRNDKRTVKQTIWQNEEQ